MWVLWIVQAVLAAALMAAVVRAFTQHYTQEVDPRVDEVLRAAVEDGRAMEIEGISRLRSLPGEFARALKEAKEERLDIGLAMDDVVREVGFRWSQRRQVLRVAASLGTTTALAGACWQFVWLTGGDHGLATLVPGLPLRWATERAAAAAAAGFGVSVVAFVAAKQIAKLGSDELRRARRLAEALEALREQGWLRVQDPSDPSDV